MFRVTYIQHSGFTVELDDRILVFDYAMGKIPELDREKPLYVFSSHAHGDHFQPFIFKLADDQKKVTYILSDDIPKSIVASAVRKSHCPVHWVGPDGSYKVDDMEIRTVLSTDEGVAFWVRCAGRVIYHAGDLNDWSWPEDNPPIWAQEKDKYLKSLSGLPKIPIDVAFVPLDPRLEHLYYRGVLEFAVNTSAKYIFPMHFWEDYSVFDKIRDQNGFAMILKKIVTIREKGQVFDLQF